MCDNQSKKVNTSTTSCHHKRKKSPQKTQPDFLPSSFKQPMAFGGMRCPMDWNEVGEPYYDRPTSQSLYQVPPTVSCEHRRKKSTKKTKSDMATGGVRCPMDWKAVGEPHYDRPSSQMTDMMGSSHSNNSMESCFNSIPKDGALSRFYPDRGDGVQKFQKLYMKDGRVVAGEEFQVISSD